MVFGHKTEKQIVSSMIRCLVWAVLSSLCQLQAAPQRLQRPACELDVCLRDLQVFQLSHPMPFEVKHSSKHNPKLHF